MKKIMGLFLWVEVLGGVVAFGQTEAESNEVVRVMLGAANRFVDDIDKNAGIRVLNSQDPDVFFGMIDTGPGWTPEGRRAAFDHFVERMGDVDFNVQTNRMWGRFADYAVGQCEDLCFTNKVPAIRRLALNATYPRRFRVSAIGTAVRMGGVNADATRFVETVSTNSLLFSMEERGKATGYYTERLMGMQESSGPLGLARRDAIRMFYRNREKDISASILQDRLFVQSVPGYAFSSNRLEVANLTLAHPEHDEDEGSHFTAVTNQLLSSGRPLVWLDVDGEGE